MSRSAKKGPYVDPKLLQKLTRQNADGPAIKTWSRDSEISPEMVGYLFAVHNGKNFIEIRVREEMVGHRLGEFAPTRKFVKHGGKMQRELEASATAGGAPGVPGAAPSAPAAPKTNGAGKNSQ